MKWRGGVAGENIGGVRKRGWPKVWKNKETKGKHVLFVNDEWVVTTGGNIDGSFEIKMAKATIPEYFVACIAIIFDKSIYFIEITWLTSCLFWIVQEKRSYPVKSHNRDGDYTWFETSFGGN